MRRRDTAGCPLGGEDKSTSQDKSTPSSYLKLPRLGQKSDFIHPLQMSEWRCSLPRRGITLTKETARPPNSTNNMGGRQAGEEEAVGVHTPAAPPAPPPLAGSLLPVVMVIRGFGQDYEIFYLATSAPM